MSTIGCHEVVTTLGFFFSKVCCNFLCKEKRQIDFNRGNLWRLKAFDVVLMK